MPVVAPRPEASECNLSSLSETRSVKDGAYYCYCAFVLRISRYSVFLWVVPTNTGIIWRGSKFYGGSRT